MGAPPPKKLSKLQAAMDRHDAAAARIGGGSLAPAGRSSLTPAAAAAAGGPPKSRSRSPDVLVLDTLGATTGR